jgi:hypothetical protein
VAFAGFASIAEFAVLCVRGGGADLVSVPNETVRIALCDPEERNHFMKKEEGLYAY